jgi:fermentation-respiration switch protein FrsA (DUF1100 family)
MYEPGNWVSRVSPTPLLMVVAEDDKLTLTDLELAAYERALEPKKLILIKGGALRPLSEPVRHIRQLRTRLVPNISGMSRVFGAILRRKEEDHE